MDNLRTSPQFDVVTTFGRLTMALRSLATKQPRALTNLLEAIYNHNPHLSAYNVALSGPHMDDSLERLEELLPDKVGNWHKYRPTINSTAVICRTKLRQSTRPEIICAEFPVAELRRAGADLAPQQKGILVCLACVGVPACWAFV